MVHHEISENFMGQQNVLVSMCISLLIHVIYQICDGMLLILEVILQL